MRKNARLLRVFLYIVLSGILVLEVETVTGRPLVTDRQLRGDEPIRSGTLDRCNFDRRSSSSTLTRTGTRTPSTFGLINVLMEVINIHLVYSSVRPSGLYRAT